MPDQELIPSLRRYFRSNPRIAIVAGALVVAAIGTSVALHSVLEKPARPAFTPTDAQLKSYAEMQSLAQAQARALQGQVLQGQNLAQAQALQQQALAQVQAIAQGQLGSQTSLAALSSEFMPTGDPAVDGIMSKYHLGRKVAGYIAQAKLQVISGTDTSVHFGITFPDNTTIDETASVTADPAFTPTAADLERSARTGSKVHGAKFTFKRTGPDQWTYSLQYHVPYSAIPADLVQKIQAAQAKRANADHFFDLVPSARALGNEAAGESAVSVVANMAASHYEGKSPLKSLGADIPLALADFAEDMMTLNGWLKDMGDLYNCATSPTNPLTAKAQRDPNSNYKHDVIDPINSAESDVMSTIAPTLASDVAGMVTHWMPFGSGAVVGLIFSTQDDAVSDYAKGRIAEASKYVVPCDNPPMVAGVFRPMKGTVVYKYNRSGKSCHGEDAQGGCWIYDETRSASGSFTLTPDQFGFLSGGGTATFDLKRNGHTDKTSAGGKSTMSGKLQVKIEIGGTPEAGVVHVSLIGADDLTYDTWGTGAGGQVIKPEHFDTASWSIDCTIKNVNLISGGSYSALTPADDGYGTCEIQIERN